MRSPPTGLIGECVRVCVRWGGRCAPARAPYCFWPASRIALTHPPRPPVARACERLRRCVCAGTSPAAKVSEGPIFARAGSASTKWPTAIAALVLIACCGGDQMMSCCHHGKRIWPARQRSNNNDNRRHHAARSGRRPVAFHCFAGCGRARHSTSKARRTGTGFAQPLEQIDPDASRSILGRQTIAQPLTSYYSPPIVY
jgi:hypothetical protein